MSKTPLIPNQWCLKLINNITQIQTLNSVTSEGKLLERYVNEQGDEGGEGDGDGVSMRVLKVRMVMLLVMRVVIMVMIPILEGGCFPVRGLSSHT
jgi:hypothetical protein